MTGSESTPSRENESSASDTQATTDSRVGDSAATTGATAAGSTATSSTSASASASTNTTTTTTTTTTALPVHVDRNQEVALSPERNAIETNSSFVIELHGQDSPAHVHCRLGDNLARVASLRTPNYYIEPNAVTPVPIDVTADGLNQPIRGELELLTGYGSESVSITVTVTPPPKGVDVDESLAAPARSADEEQPSLVEEVTTQLGLDMGTLAVIGLGLFALALAVTVTSAVGGPVAAIGVGIVFAGVAVALFLLSG